MNQFALRTKNLIIRLLSVQACEAAIRGGEAPFLMLDISLLQPILKSDMTQHLAGFDTKKL